MASNEFDFEAEFASAQEEVNNKKVEEIDFEAEFQSAQDEVNQAEKQAEGGSALESFASAVEPVSDTVIDFAESAGNTVADLGLGLAANINRALGIEGSVERIESQQKEFRDAQAARQERSPISSTVGQFGGLLGTSLIPGAQGVKLGGLLTKSIRGSGKLANLAKNIVASGAAGASGAGVIALGSEKDVKGIAEQTAIGAVAGGTLGAAATGARGLLGKVLGRKATPAEAAELTKTLKAQGIKPTAGQVLKSERLENIEEFGKSIPVFGTSRALSAQDKAAADAVNEFVTSLGKSSGLPTEGVVTPSQHILNGLSRKLGNLRKVEDKLYDSIRVSADKAGTSSLPIFKSQVEKSLSLMDDIIAPSAGDKAMVKQLKAFGGLEGKNFSQLHELRKKISNSIDKVQKQIDSGNASRETYGAMIDLKNSLSDEMQGLADQAGPQVFKRFQQANKFHKDQILPFQDINFKGMDDFSRVDTIVDKFVKSNQPGRAKILYKSLDFKGKQAFSYGVAQKALDKAVKDGVTDPVKFVREIDKLGKTLDVAFDGTTRRTFEGVKRAVQIINNKNKSKAVDQLLSGAVIGGGAVGAVAAPAAAIPVATGITGVKLLLTSEAGVKLLQRLSTLKPTSNEAIQIVNRMQEEIRRQQEGE